jgi:hypothetical protein
MRDRHHAERVAVGWRLRHKLGSDDAACTGTIVDHHLFAELFAQMRADQPSDHVVAAAGRERDDQPHRAVRIIGLCGGRDSQRQHTQRKTNNSD